MAETIIEFGVGANLILTYENFYPRIPSHRSLRCDLSFLIFLLFSACFSLLMNIAESVKVEDKIRKRNIVGNVIQCLQRTNIPLLVTVVKFLHKLSIRFENKDEMVRV